MNREFHPPSPIPHLRLRLCPQQLGKFRDGAGFVHVTPEGWEVWLGEDADIAQTQRHRLDAAVG